MSFNEKEVQKAVGLMKELGLKRFKFKTKEGEIELELPMHASPHLEPSFHPPIPPSPAGQHDSTSSSQQFIPSPLVGTFYRRPSPESNEFVSVGDKVSEGTVVCIVEAMKVMNEVKAGKSGTIVEILLDDGDPVEFGTHLFRIE